MSTMSSSGYKSKLESDAMAFLDNFDGKGQVIASVDPHAAHSHGASGHDHGSMKMYFHWGVEETILFESWKTESCLGMLVAVVLVFVMGFLYEGLRWLRVHMQKRKPKQTFRGDKTDAVQLSANIASPHNDDRALLNASNGEHAHSAEEGEGGRKDCTTSKHNGAPAASSTHAHCKNQSFIKGNFLSSHRLFFSFLYFVQLVLAYLLMLIAMTYNYWLMGAVTVGAAAGHWLFANWACLDDDVTADACH